MSRKIIHIDMDCFYAAVEMRDNPRLRHRPLAVGGQAERRGVIATCNYLARDYGVHSALSSAIAKSRCPELIIVPPNLNKYRDVSKQIHQIFLRYTELIEPLSLDEAYLDVSDVEQFQGSGTYIAQAIKQQIEEELNLTASAGVAPNKFLAKVASDWNKPDGLKVIAPDEVDSFVYHLPVSKIHGVGKVTANKLHNLNIRTCGELQSLSQPMLLNKFGKFGNRLYRFARGIDDRSVSNERQRKSVSVERTFSHDCRTVEELTEKLPKLTQSLQQRLSTKSVRGFKAVFVKLKFNDFTATTIERRAEILIEDVLITLIAEAYRRKSIPVRLLGIGVRLDESSPDQLEQLELPFY